MSKKLQFKAPHGRMVSSTLGEITNENLTREVYNKLIQDNEGHKDLFEEVDIPEPELKIKSTKPQKNDVQA